MKENKNHGRRFWGCRNNSSDKRCGFFAWAAKGYHKKSDTQVIILFHIVYKTKTNQCITKINEISLLNHFQTTSKAFRTIQDDYRLLMCVWVHVFIVCLSLLHFSSLFYMKLLWQRVGQDGGKYVVVSKHGFQVHIVPSLLSCSIICPVVTSSFITSYLLM